MINSQEMMVLSLSGSNAKDGKFRVKKFNGQNYQLWKMQMKHYLYLPLGGKENKPTRNESLTERHWENTVVPSGVGSF